MTRSIQKVLIANRGEIALRVMRTARSLGIKTVAVYTEADLTSPHCSEADEAVLIGTGPAAESYLSIDKLIAAALATGADAIHPGYGFLSERADFAQACKKAGVVFVGPSPVAIDLMGNKAAAKRKMIEAGVPCVPGYEGDDQSDEVFAKVAREIGFPVMVKAAAGGGGKGMRLVDNEGELISNLALARSEADAAFGSDQLILEKAIERPRHVEIQVLADEHGNCLHLGERDCSVQRRHQKVVEEAPCPILTQEQRDEMGKAAVAAARSVDYVGAGTVEFLLAEDGQFYFLEMNTRLQVEHPVTEEVTGRDLVALQFSVAQGEPLNFQQEDVLLQGHAIEARLYAEDPDQGFLPQTGDIALWQPSRNKAVRTDEGVASGQSLSPFYDPMLAKIIARGGSRDEARLNLLKGLQEIVLFGVKTNRDFLIKILQNKTFAAGQATTAFIEESFEDNPNRADQTLALVVAAALLYKNQQQRHFAESALVSEALLGWSSAGSLSQHFKMLFGEDIKSLSISQQKHNQVQVSVNDESYLVDIAGKALRVDGKKIAVSAFMHQGNDVFLALENSTHHFVHLKASNTAESETASGLILAPMHGQLLQLFVGKGNQVKEGDRLAVLEAMKMQHEIVADQSGRVFEIHASAGQQVRAKQELMTISEEEEQQGQ